MIVFELVEIFEFGSEWSDHAAAAWVAVRYVTTPPHAIVAVFRVFPVAYTFSRLLMASVWDLLVGFFQTKYSHYL